MLVGGVEARGVRVVKVDGKWTWRTEFRGPFDHRGRRGSARDKVRRHISLIV